MFHQKALGDPGFFEEIFEVGIADHRIEIHSSRVVFGQKDAVVGPEPLYNIRIAVTERVDLLKCICFSLAEHGKKLSEDLCRTFRVIDSSVMV